jgi:hypothetical protein
MGYSEDIMNEIAMKDLRTVFPRCDGWQGRPIPAGNQGEKIFSFSRRSQGKAEQAVALVSFASEASPDISGIFATVCEKIPNCTKKLLLIPRSAVVPPLASAIEVKEMKTFGFENYRLVWLTKKKNAMAYIQETGIEA